MMKIRFASKDDIKELYAINSLFNGSGCTTLEHMEAFFKEIINEYVILAENEGNIIGYCCLHKIHTIFNSDVHMEITELFVREEHRQKGIGRAMIDFVRYNFTDNCMGGIKLLTGEKNTVAQAFYENCGFRRTGEVQYGSKTGNNKE